MIIHLNAHREAGRIDHQVKAFATKPDSLRWNKIRPASCPLASSVHTNETVRHTKRHTINNCNKKFKLFQEFFLLSNTFTQCSKKVF